MKKVAHRPAHRESWTCNPETSMGQSQIWRTQRVISIRIYFSAGGREPCAIISATRRLTAVVDASHRLI
jgi:hypothetical protein